MHFDIGVMTIFCVLIILAVLAANGRLQSVINAWNGTTLPQPAGGGSSWTQPGSGGMGGG